MTVEQGADGRSQEQLYRIVILVLVAALVVTGCVVIWLVSEKNKANDEVADLQEEVDSYAAGPEARDAAEAILQQMISYDYRDIEDEYVWLDDFSNEDLRRRFEKRVGNLAKVIRLTKVKAEGEVVHSAYTTIDSTSATVLAFVRQRLVTPEDKQGSIAEQWTTMEMVREDEGSEWSVDGIEIVTVPPPS